MQDCKLCSPAFLHTKELMNLRDIKTKQKIQAIKTKDTKRNIQHFIKQQTIHNKNVDKKEDASVKPNAQVQATNKVSIAAKQTVIESKRRATKFIKQKRKEYKIKSTSKKSVVESNHELQPQRISYIAKAKKQVVNKVNTSKIKQSTEQIVSNPIVQNTAHAIKKSFHIVKKGVSTLNTLFSFGTGLILLIVITLFVGTFSVLAQDGGSNSEIVSLSEEVIAYENTIRKYAKEYDIEDYVSLLQAIMMQESGGKGNDPMQASESGYNTKYPRVPNGITEPEYSIDVGTHTFSDCVKKANIKDPSDTEHIYLALQGYNYGSGYIDWAFSNFGGYSKYNAQQFSDMKKQELNVSGYGDPSYVDHVMRYVGITFRSGTNPNFNNMEAWITKNPYAKAGLCGQCTWFAWGRFYELYGYDPGFTGNGWDCVDELLKAHPDKFERSTTPKAGAVFSGIGKNHVGIVLKVDGNNITIQDGNYDGITNTFEDAKKDWQTNTYTLDYYRSRMGGIVFANPK